MEAIRQRFLSHKPGNAKFEQTAQVLDRLVITHEDALRIKEIFVSEMAKGLEHGLKSSSLQMENTYVTELLDGSEEGSFLALDLGGTNFRVMLLVLSSGRITREEVSYYHVPDATRLGPGLDLFDFLASCIDDFCTKNNLLEEGSKDEALPLGFTFSFPMEQSAIDSGLLVTWTKSFDCSGVVGTDAAKHLAEALRRRGGRVGNDRVVVSAILNDTTGTLVKGSYDDPDTVIGLILGTGCNGAYVERAENMVRQKFKEGDVKEVIVDPEFGAFGDNGCLDFLRSDFDKAVNAASLFPGSFTYEKYFSGKYIGELARRMLLKLSQDGILSSSISKVSEVNSVTAEHISFVELDSVKNSDSRTKDILVKLGLAEPSEEDVGIMKCALLVSVPLAVMISRLKGAHKKAKVAVTGSLYKHSPRLKTLLEEFIRKYLDRPGEVETDTFLTDDGSGKGAGLVAAIAQRLAKKHEK